MTLPSVFLCLTLIILKFSGSIQQDTCNQEILDQSIVTQCQANICEPIRDKPEGSESTQRSSDWPATSDQVVQIVSNRKGDRFKLITYKAQDRTDHYYEQSHVNGTIFVDTSKKYQKILGFGTTLTDAACTNVDDLPDDIRNKLINDYFNPDTGIALNLIKIPIGSTKYSYSNYVLDEPDNNLLELSPYDLNHRIQLIKDATKASGKLKNRIKILASSTSAPPEYKTNNKMIHAGHLREDKTTDYARYLTSFIAAYKQQGINIWSLIVTESPVTMNQLEATGLSDTVDYNSMAMKPSEAASLVRAISSMKSIRNDIHKFRIMLLGDNRSHIPVWIDTILKSRELAESVAGIAYTCDNNKVAPYDNLSYVTKRYPNKYLLATQSSINSPVKLGNWQYAENYGTEMVKNLEFGSVGWIDFNMALNLQGGPCLSDKFKADAAIMADPKIGVYYRNPSFYAIGHLSKYVKSGSIRVKSVHHFGAHMFANQHIAFLTPDNYVIVYVMNNNIGPMPITIAIDTRTRVETLLDTKSFNTFIFRL